MNKKDIRIELTKYKCNIRRAYIVMTDDLLTLVNLNLHWDVCKIHTSMFLDLDDGSTLEIGAVINEHAELIAFVGDYRTEHEMSFAHLMSDYDLCAMQDSIKLWK